MSVRFLSGGMLRGEIALQEALAELIMYQAKVKAAGLADLTDSSTGTARETKLVLGVSTAFVDEAAAGSDLAGEATARAALGAVALGAKLLLTQANAAAKLVGIPQVSVGITGVAALGAVGVATGAGTGVKATETNLIRKKLNTAIYVAAGLTNRVTAAVGQTGLLDFSGVPAEDRVFGAVGAIDTTATGTAGTPGVKKAAFDVAVGLWKNDLATIAAALNAVTNDTIPDLPVAVG